ncbi:mitoferrin-2 [Sphaerodactylus townsendi]|uniref:mitoferrin-2 n=1 Tax=Sphaerodactylus townsendi TaxID=933632 RepID=UPI002025CA62|nr:mitoferrin-2 [Sphaerodactylus townsendi]
MELGAGGAAGPRQRDGAEPVRLLFLLLGGGGGGGSGWAWSPGGGGEGGAGTGTETGPEPDYEGLPRGSAASTHMLAGAVAGVLEHSLMYPVDCVKVSRGAKKQERAEMCRRERSGVRAGTGGDESFGVQSWGEAGMEEGFGQCQHMGPGSSVGVLFLVSQ